MKGQHKQRILSPDHLQQASFQIQIGVSQCGQAWILELRTAHIWETQIIFFVVVASARDQAVHTVQIHVPDQIIEQVGRDVLIIDQTNRIARPSVPDAAAHLLQPASADIVVQIQFSVPGDLDHMGFDLIEIEDEEDVVQVVSDQVFQIHDVPLAILRQLDEPTDHGRRHLDQCVARTIRILLPQDLDGQIKRFVVELGQFVQLVDHQGKDKGTDLFHKISAHEFLLPLGELLFVNKANVLLVQKLQ